LEAKADASPSVSERAASQPVRVSVIVPHFDDLANLEQCLTALGRQTFPPSDFEIIVADNGSPAGRSAVERVIAGRAKLVVVTERGAGPARNGGVAHAAGAILAFTDSDCRPEPHWLAEGVEALADHDFVGGRMEVLIDDPARVSASEAFEKVFAFHNERYVRRKGFTVTANLFCPRALFERVGGFVASGISEDLDWCLRARNVGYRIGYAAKAGVGHPARRTWPELLKKWSRINNETFGLLMSRRGGSLKWALRMMGSPILAVAHTPRVLFTPKLVGPGQRLGALTTLYRLRWWRIGDDLRMVATRLRTG
jgi:glycosyltransferase involved in cell wall biosynthesis